MRGTTHHFGNADLDNESGICLYWMFSMFFNFCCSYKIVLDSDAEEFGGHKRLDHNVVYHTFPEPWSNRANHIYVSNYDNQLSPWWTLIFFPSSAFTPELPCNDFNNSSSYFDLWHPHIVRGGRSCLTPWSLCAAMRSFLGQEFGSLIHLRRGDWSTYGEFWMPDSNA